jgi:hypothetical protein
MAPSYIREPRRRARRTCCSDASGRPRDAARSGREIEPGAGRALFNLDDPQVGVEGDFPFEPCLRLAGIDAVSGMRGRKKPLDARPDLGGRGLRRRPIERGAAVQMVDFHENRASLGGAAATEDRACPFHSTPAQIGGDPNVGAEAQPLQCVPARAARVNCLTSRGVISAESGKPWVRSKSRNACWVARPSFPSGLTG